MDQVLGAVIGHEIAGTIEAVGPGVVDLTVGDRVANVQRRSCHRCDDCLRGQTVLCASGVLYGEAIDGGYAEFCVIDELSIAVIPDGVGFDEAAVTACAVGTGLHALRQTNLRAGERVVVTGASGGVGVHTLQVARAMGVEVVAVTSSAGKASLVEPYADHVVVMVNGHFDAEIRKRRLQPHAVLDLTAGFTLGDSLRAVRRGGSVVIVGNLENRPVNILPGAFITREINLIGSKACTRLELQDCLSLIDRRLVDVKIHDVLALSDAPAAHELLAKGQTLGRVVLRP